MSWSVLRPSLGVALQWPSWSKGQQPARLQWRPTCEESQVTSILGDGIWPNHSIRLYEPLENMPELPQIWLWQITKSLSVCENFFGPSKLNSTGLFFKHVCRVSIKRAIMLYSSSNKSYAVSESTNHCNMWSLIVHAHTCYTHCDPKTSCS